MSGVDIERLVVNTILMVLLAPLLTSCTTVSPNECCLQSYDALTGFGDTTYDDSRYSLRVTDTRTFRDSQTVDPVSYMMTVVVTRKGSPERKVQFDIRTDFIEYINYSKHLDMLIVGYRDETPRGLGYYVVATDGEALYRTSVLPISWGRLSEDDVGCYLKITVQKAESPERYEWYLVQRVDDSLQLTLVHVGDQTRPYTLRYGSCRLHVGLSIDSLVLPEGRSVDSISNAFPGCGRYYLISREDAARQDHQVVTLVVNADRYAYDTLRIPRESLPVFAYPGLTNKPWRPWVNPVVEGYCNGITYVHFLGGYYGLWIAVDEDGDVRVVNASDLPPGLRAQRR